MFSTCPDSSLPCPRCRHVSLVGNSVQALRKNFAVLSLIHSASSSAAATSASASAVDCDYTDEDENEDEDEEGEAGGGGGGDDDDGVGRCSRGSHASSSGNCGPVIEVGAHQEVKLVRKLGDGRKAGVEMWTAVIGSSGGGRCRHRVAVKKVAVGAGEEIDVEWVMGQLENLRRMSMWCRNVCTFHGTVRMEGGCLGLVMDRCYGSVQSEMQRNEGRLTLEQILRFYFVYFHFHIFFGILCV